MSYLKREEKKQKISYENTSDERDNLHLAYAFNEEIFFHFAIENEEYDLMNWKLLSNGTFIWTLNHQSGMDIMMIITFCYNTQKKSKKKKFFSDYEMIRKKSNIIAHSKFFLFFLL